MLFIPSGDPAPAISGKWPHDASVGLLFERAPAAMTPCKPGAMDGVEGGGRHGRFLRMFSIDT